MEIKQTEAIVAGFLYSCTSSFIAGRMQQWKLSLALSLMVLTSMSIRVTICSKGTQRQLQSHVGGV
eukprot:12192843-Ditylum_brightwellii.AAC.1